jgi:hypothetical protein
MLQTHALALRLFAGADEWLGHATQLAPSAAEYLPTSQSIQLLRLVAPVAAEDVPPAQLMHVPVPVVFLYFPAKHDTHVPPSGPVYPELQEQLVNSVHVVQAESTGHAVHVEAATLEYLPATQFKHTVVAVILENLPAEQSAHILAPPAKYCPAGHGVHALAPACDAEPSAHSLQIVAPSAE